MPRRAGTVKACEASLKRLKTDRIDLYLLHWRGQVPFAETMAGFDDLMQAGKIQAFGVSNLDLKELQEWLSVSRADKTLANQVLYNTDQRGMDFDLLPWCLDRKIALMAYCPLAQGAIAHGPSSRRWRRATAPRRRRSCWPGCCATNM